METIWIPGGVYEKHHSIEVIFSKDEQWFQLLGLPVEKKRVQNTKKDTIQPQSVEKPEVSPFPMILNLDDLEIKLVSVQRHSSKMIFTFLLQNNVEDFKTKYITARIINSEGEEYRAKKSDLSYRKLIKGIPTKCVIEFEKKAEASDLIPVLELSINRNREILQLRNVPIME